MNIEVCCAYSDEELFANISANARSCPNWISRQEAHEGHAVIVGGGPSLQDKLPLVRKRRALGQTIFALNGACRFLNENGIIPDYQVFLDSHPEMTNRIGNAGQYLVASQCSPNLLLALKGSRVTLWHLAIDNIIDHLPDHDQPHSLTGGGVTVGLSAMCLVYAMGFRKLHLFGYDSSNKEGQCHAYAVPEHFERLGGEKIGYVQTTLGGKTFQTTLAMTKQAECFPRVCNDLIDLGCTITLDCEGLIMAVLDEMKKPESLAA